MVVITYPTVLCTRFGDNLQSLITFLGVFIVSPSYTGYTIAIVIEVRRNIARETLSRCLSCWKVLVKVIILPPNWTP